MDHLIIRKETSHDYHETEHMVMRAFWNLHGPGCDEHLLVHKLREAPEYLPELSRVAELDGRIVGAILYSRARVVDGDKEREVLTFGPLAVEPTLCNRGIGASLLQETVGLAREAGYGGIVICGEPDYYPKHGFLPCERFRIVHPDLGNGPAFMALPLNESFEDVHGVFHEAPVFETCSDEAELKAFSRAFPYYTPLTLACQWLHVEKLGRISQVQKNSFTIRFWEQELTAKLKGHFYEGTADQLPVVGDYVTFLYNPRGDAVILDRCERRSLLTRPDQAKTGVTQFMVANADLCFVVTALNEDYSYNRIARYVSMARQGGVEPVVVLTKADLCPDAERYVQEVETISEGLRVHAVSATEGRGLEALSPDFVPGATICLLGSSGAGKSTLINAIAGTEVMKTGEIRASDDKGRHTTTHRQLIDLPNGVWIIDTPGMREVGLAGAAEGLDETFADILALESQCRFRNCRHETEPGCAVKAAIASGALSRERWDLYRNLGQENAKNYAKMKQISKWSKAYKKNKER